MALVGACTASGGRCWTPLADGNVAGPGRKHRAALPAPAAAARARARIAQWPAVGSQAAVKPKHRQGGPVVGHRRSQRARWVCEGSSALVQDVQTVTLPESSADTAVDEVLGAIHNKADQLVDVLEETSIYLVGMMGSGKTTVGRILAEALGYAFFDSDSLVEQGVGMRISSIFAEQGETAFRELESQSIAQLASMSKLIVATGGGAVLRPANWACMRGGITVWLDVPAEALAKRVVAAGLGSRPILSEGSASEDAFGEALARLQGVFEKRKHLYPEADIRVSLSDLASNLDCDGVNAVTPAQIALSALEAVEAHIALNGKVQQSREEWTAMDVQCVRDDFGACIIPFGFAEEKRSHHPVLSC